MKLLINLIGFGAILIGLTAEAAIVNNSTSSPTAEDSVSWHFYSLDSLGSPTTADSLYILVSGPDGAVAWRDSMATADGRVVSTTVRGKQFYHFKEQVSNLDGTGVAGAYMVSLIAKNNATGLLTSICHHFQIISRELSDQLQMIEDSVLVQGGVIDTNLTMATPDSGEVARWVWNTPQTNHDGSGTFGGYLDTTVSGVSFGAGSYGVTLLAHDSADGLDIPGVRLTIRNLAQTAMMADGFTDVSGEMGVSLDADSFVVIAQAPGYLFGNSDTLVVSAAATDTIFGLQFDPGAPAIAGLCRVWGYLYDISGQPEDEADVAAWLPEGTVLHSSGIIIPNPVSAATDTSGYFYIDLLPSDSLSDGTVYYDFTVSRSDGTVVRQRLLVPDSASWRLTW